MKNNPHRQKFYLNMTKSMYVQYFFKQSTKTLLAPFIVIAFLFSVLFLNNITLTPLIWCILGIVFTACSAFGYYSSIKFVVRDTPKMLSFGIYSTKHDVHKNFIKYDEIKNLRYVESAEEIRKAELATKGIFVTPYNPDDFCQMVAFEANVNGAYFIASTDNERLYNFLKESSIND